MNATQLIIARVSDGFGLLHRMKSNLSSLLAILLVMAALLFSQNAAHAAITYVGSASNPTDNNSLGSSPVAVVPPGGMTAGDLVILVANSTVNNVTMTMSAQGGQAWTSQTNINTTGSQRIFWARYNGSWSANPSVAFSDTSNTTVVMHVFRPSASQNTWALDVAQTSSASTPSGANDDVTINGINTITDGALVFATWTSVDNNTWSLQTAGWTNAGGSQYRNRQSSDASQSSAYRVMATAGATGDVVNRESSLGPDNGNISILAFKELAPVPFPIVTSINTASSNPATANTMVSWTVVFDTAVTGVDVTDFSLVQAGGVAGATLGTVSGSGTTYTVTANTGTGTIGSLALRLVDNDSIVNASGTPLGSPGAGNGTFTGQAYTICSAPSNIPVGVSVSCQCDTFSRPTLNPSTIFNSNWIVSTSDSTGILPSIVNSDYLRLTNNTGNNAKAATVPGIFPAAGNYISVEFRQYAYNGSGADGIAVTLSDYAVPAVPGAYGGSLGYAQKTGITGFAGGWLGVALDEYGNYQNPTEGRLGGPGFIVQSVGARGSGSGMNGYRWLGGTTALTPKIDDKASATPSLGYYYQVIVDARNEPTSTTISVNRDTGAGYTSLISIPNVYSAATAQGFTQAPVPANWQISFTGSTGGSTNIHEIGSLRICASSFLPPSGGVAGDFNAIDEAYGTPPLAVQNYLGGRIFTKLVGTPFKLNVAALSNSQILTTYALTSSKTVTVKLVDNSDSLTDTTKDCTLTCSAACTGKAAVTGGTQTLTFASGAGDKGQKQSPSFTLNSAYQKLVAVISDGTTTACSTDAFSVRPLSIASVTSSNATNAGTSGGPIFKAGSDNFALTATTTGVAGSPSGYNGVMKINNKVLQAASPATVAGALSGTTFPSATPGTPSSTATGATFTYSEVGGFKLPGYDPATDTTTRRSVYDGVATADECTTPGLTTAQCNALRAAAWTGVDGISSLADCVLDSYSNTKDASGKYGCNFGLLPNTVVFGRFVPDHFDTVVKYDTGTKVFMSCPTGLTCPASGDLVYGNGFVYSGQPFTTEITARNAAGAITLNYDTGKTLSKAVTLSAWDVAGGASANPGGGALTSNTVPSTAFSAGVATVTNTPTYTFAAVPTAPTDIFIRAVDADGISSLRATPSASVEGGVKVVSGRVKLVNVYGSELLPLTVTATLQYWGGASTGYVTSTTDNVNTVTAAKISRTNCQGALLTGVACNALGAISSVISVPVSPPPYGVFSINLAAPGAGKTGSEDLTVNAGGWPSYLPSSTGRATFGVYKGRNDFIYQRESY